MAGCFSYGSLFSAKAYYQNFIKNNQLKAVAFAWLFKKDLTNEGG